MAENLASCVRTRGFYNGVARGLRDLFLNNSWFVGFNKIKTLKFAFCLWLRIWRGLKFGRGLLLNNGVALKAKGVKSVTLK